MSRGYTEAFSADVPSGGRVRYMDDGSAEPGFIELIPATTHMAEMFTLLSQTTREWDGINEPIRPFPA